MTREDIERAVKGYEDIYRVDIFGNVTRVKDGTEAPQHISRFGYANVMLYKNGKQKQHKVHRLIAEAFIPNPYNKPQVNHLDGNKAHNVVWNLEWSTAKENNIHASDTGLIHTAKKVMVVETGEVFNSLGSCARAIGGNAGNISRCLNTDKSNTHKGLHFEWVV